MMENPITPNPNLSFRLGSGFAGGCFFSSVYARALSVVEINTLTTTQDGP